MDGSELHARIEALLREGGAGFEVIEHPPIGSAEDAARLRGTPLGIGGKAIVMKLYGRGFGVLALAADRALDNPALRRGLGVARYRFATPDELRRLTGLEPGCVPPFGRPVLDLPLFVDRALAEGERIAFTTGTRTRSILTTTAAWLAAARPAAVLPLSRPA